MAREFNWDEQTIIDMVAFPKVGDLNVVNQSVFRDLGRRYCLVPRKHEPKSINNLGVLSTLPVEVLSMIVPQMDVLSAVRFRRVSRLARELIYSNRLYRVISRKADLFLRVFLKSGVASQWSLIHIHELLHQDKCSRSSCNRIGNLLHLPTGTRICGFHMEYSAPWEDWGVRSLNAVVDMLEISKETVMQHGSLVTTIPGNYSSLFCRLNKSVDLVCTRTLVSRLSEQAARVSGVDRDVYEGSMTRKSRKAPWDCTWKYTLFMDAPILKEHTTAGDYIYTCPFCPLDESEYEAEELFEHAKMCELGRLDEEITLPMEELDIPRRATQAFMVTIPGLGEDLSDDEGLLGSHDEDLIVDDDLLDEFDSDNENPIVHDDLINKYDSDESF